ncbi:HD-GYP domain-containing protein [Bacillales bacterium AN1005]
MAVTTQYTVETLLESLKSHCPATYEHSIRVGKLLEAFTAYLGMEYNHMFELGSLHDCGKLLIPSKLLNKEAKLTKSEYEEIKKHTRYGYEIILDTTDFPHTYANTILFHHENIDKSGYYALAGKDIPLLGKIIRIIDSYDTMLNGRIYQKSQAFEKVINELIQLKEKMYDAHLVDNFISFIKNHYPMERQNQI